ncbi:MAG: CBS domain-containing protein [Actinomycetes bacterium]
MAIVSEIMTSEVRTVHPDMSIIEVASVLADGSIGAVPVVNDADEFVGLLRDEDLLLREAGIHVPTTIALLPGIEFTLPSHLKRFDEELRIAAASTVGELMQTDPETVGPDTSLEDLATLMHDKQVTHVPVIDGNGKVVGIVARGDVIRHLARAK